MSTQYRDHFGRNCTGHYSLGEFVRLLYVWGVQWTSSKSGGILKELMKKDYCRRLLVTIQLLALFFLGACEESGSEGAADTAEPTKIEVSKEVSRPVVYVPVAPYRFALEKVAGDLAEIRVIVGPDEDPHSYSPTPRQVADMAQANLLCAGELGFEANFFVKLGDGQNGPAEFLLLEGLDLLEGHCDHPSHQTETTEDDHDHVHEDLNDPHVWLSTTALQKQAESFAAQLKKMLPAEKAKQIDENLNAWKIELSAINGELKEQLERHQGRKFYVYHAAFGYFARDYGLEQVAIETGNRKPTPQQLAKISKSAKEDGIELIFIQPQFDESSAAALAEAIGGKVAYLDPLEEDIISNLRNLAKAVTSGAE